MMAKVLIMLLVVALRQSQSSVQVKPVQRIQIGVEFGHNRYFPIEKYFLSQQKVQITDLMSEQDNKTYHFCYIQSLLNSDIIEQDCLKLFNQNKDNLHCYNNKSSPGQKSASTTSPITYKLNDIIQGESVLGKYYYSSTSGTNSSHKSEDLKTEYLLLVKSNKLLGIRLDEKCLQEQSNKQQINTTKCDNTQSLVQLFLQQTATKAKFIELLSYTPENNNTNNNFKQLLLLTQSHIYSVQLLIANQTQSQSNNPQEIIIELLAKLENSQQHKQKQQEEYDGEGEQMKEEFTTFIIDKRDNNNNNQQTTTINLLLFTNKKNTHSYKLSASTLSRVKLQSVQTGNLSPSATGVGEFSENKKLQLLSGSDVEGEVVYYGDTQRDSGILMLAGKSIGGVSVSADVGSILGKYDHISKTISANDDKNNINDFQPVFYPLLNTHRCHKIHQYKGSYVFLECKNHLLYFKVSDLVECFIKSVTNNNIQQCLNLAKQSHLNLGFHIQSAHFQSNQDSHYLTITTLDKYSHFYIDYCQQTRQINSINNIATYYYPNQTLKTVYRTYVGRAIVLTKGNAVMVRQQEEKKEILCKTVDENSRRQLAQPAGRFTGYVVVQGVCKDALLPNNDTSTNNKETPALQTIQNSTLCRYKVPTVVTITHTVNRYKSIWQVLLATGLTTTILSVIFCLIKSHKLKQIYNVLEEEKEHGQKVMQGTVVTQVNQSQEESIGVGFEPVLGK